MSSDCGFGRQGANREIAFYKASAIAQGCNIVRKELGLEPSYVPAADPMLQIDIVPEGVSLVDASRCQELQQEGQEARRNLWFPRLGLASGQVALRYRKLVQAASGNRESRDSWRSVSLAADAYDQAPRRNRTKFPCTIPRTSSSL